MAQTQCPICRKPTARQTHEQWPFCSERCRMIDLGKWAKEEYRIPDRRPLPDTDPETDDGYPREGFEDDDSFDDEST